MPTAVHVAWQAGQVLVEPGDEHVADAVEQPGQRQQHAVGARRQLAHREVGGDEQAEHDGEERPDVRPGSTTSCPGCARV